MRYNLPQQLLRSGKRLVDWCLRAVIRTGLGYHKEATENTRGRIANRPELSSLADGLTDIYIDDILLIYINTVQGEQMVNQI